jgi:hypothetical protein
LNLVYWLNTFAWENTYTTTSSNMVGSALLARRWRAAVRPRARGFNTWTNTIRGADEEAALASRWYDGERATKAFVGASENFAFGQKTVLAATAAAGAAVYLGSRESNDDLRSFIGLLSLPTGLIFDGARAAVSCESTSIVTRASIDWESADEERRSSAAAGVLGSMTQAPTVSLKTRGFNRSASGGLPQAFKQKLRARGFYVAVRDGQDVDVDVVSRRYNTARSDSGAGHHAEKESYENYVRAWHNPVENRFERLAGEEDVPPTCEQLLQYYKRKNRVFDRNTLCEDQCAHFVAEEVPTEATVAPLTLFVSGAGSVMEAGVHA